LKRFASGILAALLVLALCPAALAAGPPTLTVSSGEVSPGGDVTVTVRIQNNPGLATMLVYLYYDTSAFTISPDDDLAAAGEFRASGSLVGNTIQTARENGRYDGDQNRDGALALWYNSSGLNTTGNGAVLTMTLHAQPGASQGEYTVALGYSAEDTRDQMGQTVSLQTASGTIAVLSDSEAEDREQEPEQEPQTPPEEDADEPEPEPTPVFLDVSGHWAELYLTQAAQLGLMEGYEGLFRPDDGMTRAEFVTVLWRASGSPAPQGPSTFTDLDPGQTWYLDAVAWAQETGVVNGVGDGRFDPDGGVTREQVSTTLFRMAGSVSGLESMMAFLYDSQFTDSGQVDDWAKAAVYWTVYQEIYCGEHALPVGTDLAPGAAADRAQIAVMIVRYFSKE
jgi:hypothetical protein